MPGFILYAIGALLIVLTLAAVVVWGRRSTGAAATSTNRILFAIVIMLFALVDKEVSSGMDGVGLLIGLVGLGIGVYGVSTESR